MASKFSLWTIRPGLAVLILYTYIFFYFVVAIELKFWSGEQLSVDSRLIHPKSFVKKKKTIERWGFHDDMIGMVEMSSYFSSDLCWFCFFFRWIFDFSLYAICQISAAQMCHWIHGFYGVQKKEAQHLLLLNWERAHG